MKTALPRFFASLWLILMSGQPIWSQSSTYLDRNAFLNASEALPGIKQAIPLEGHLGPPGGLGMWTVSNVTFRTFPGSWLIVRYESSGSSPGAYLYSWDCGVPLSLHFATPVRAFGADFSSLLSPFFSSFTASVSLDNGESFNFTAPASESMNANSQFFGFISPTPIRDLTFSDGGIFPLGAPGLHEELIGNLYMVMEIPEPGSFALLGLGVAILFLRRRRRRACDCANAGWSASQ